MRAPRPERPGPASVITQAIIERLEAGVRPWRQRWTAGAAACPLRACGTPYRGINRIWLGMVAEAGNYTSPFWLTYRQALNLSAQVRKGARGTTGIFYTGDAKADETTLDDEARLRTRRVLKSFIVFNAGQIDGLPDRFHSAIRPLPTPTERDAALDRFFATIPARVVSGSEPCYAPLRDEITMPDLACFADRDQYRSTLAHELVHWTGHPTRLDRTFGKRFGSDAYAAEELVAELAAAMLGADLGLPVGHLDDHASYLACWLRILRADRRAILSAAAKAEQAAALLLELGGRTAPAPA